MKLRIETSKLQAETSKNFEMFFAIFMLKFCLCSKFGVISWFTKQITKFVKRKFQGRSEKFYKVPGWSFEVSIQSFIPIRVSKLGGMPEPFWL